MSIKVSKPDLPAEIAKRGPGFFLTSIMDSRPHAAHLSVEVAREGDQVEIRTPVGRTSRANAQMQPSVTLLWPAVEAGDHSLIVDGEARLDGDDHVIVTVINAVLHRPAPPSTS